MGLQFVPLHFHSHIRPNFLQEHTQQIGTQLSDQVFGWRTRGIHNTLRVRVGFAGLRLQGMRGAPIPYRMGHQQRALYPRALRDGPAHAGREVYFHPGLLALQVGEFHELWTWLQNESHCQCNSWVGALRSTMIYWTMGAQLWYHFVKFDVRICCECKHGNLQMWTRSKSHAVDY